MIGRERSRKWWGRRGQEGSGDLYEVIVLTLLCRELKPG